MLPSPHSPTVLFDLSELGKGYKNPAHLSGIPRVVESLLARLVKKSPYPLRFTSVEERYGGEGYLTTHHPELRSAYVTWPGVRDRLHFQVSRWREHRRQSPGFVTRGLEALQRRLAVPEWRIPEACVDSASLFHSLVGPIPPQLRRNSQMAVVLTVHDLIPVFHPEYSWPRWDAYIQQAFASLRPDAPTDHVLCVSATVKEEFCGHTRFPEERVFVTPLAADERFFYPCRNPEEITSMRRQLGLDDRPYFLALGQFAPRKNFEGMLHAFAHASTDSSMKDVCLVLAGHGGDDWVSRIEGLSRKWGVEGRVKQPGFVPNEYLAALYSGAEAFVFPTLAEGFGLPAVEAMRCGTPLICSDLPVLHEVAGDAALYVAPHEPEDIARGLVKVMTESKVREQLRTGGLARAGRFSWDQCAEATLHAYAVALKASGHL